jgi:biotin carboxyl carrier protein/23S rRNA pseudoU1915 N3-methylase RlmH
LAEVKQARGKHKNEAKTVTYKDIHNVMGKKGAADQKKTKDRQPVQSSGSKSALLMGLLVALGGYTGWLLVANTLEDEVPSTAEVAAVDNDTAEAEVAAQEPQNKAGEKGGSWHEVKSLGASKMTVTSPTAGSLSSINIKNGEPVFVGQSAFTVSSNRLSSDIETIKLEIQALERLAKTNKTEFVQQGLKDEQQKLRSLMSKQKKIVKINNAGTVSGLNKKAGAFVKKGEVVFYVAGAYGLPRFRLKSALEISISKGMRVEVRSKTGKVANAKIVHVAKSTRGQVLTLKVDKGTLKVHEIRLLKP